MTNRESPKSDGARVEPLQAVKGMNDLFEDALVQWRAVEARARDTFLAYGFGEIRTPVVEDLALFVRGVGEATDIVGKEMFVFADSAGKHQLCLRPENTAGVVRAMIENGKIVADTFHKVFYLGAQFRNERPQAGRYRQFHQLGAEVLGYAEPAADAEVVALVHTLLQALGVGDARLLINTLGDVADRPRYREALRAYFAPHHAKLSATSQERLDKNPLRILDSKDPVDIELCRNAPKPREFLSPAAAAHFAEVCTRLDALGVPYTVDDQLVRGLDYYTRTVFEFVGERGLGAQSTLAAGGRYDGLVATLGGRETPAVGFAAGVERLLLSMLAHERTVARLVPDIAVIGADDLGRAFADKLAFQLRALGVRVESDLRSRGVKAQMKSADKSGARFTLVLGSREIESMSAELKQMQGGGVSQVTLDASSLKAAMSNSVQNVTP